MDRGRAADRRGAAHACRRRTLLRLFAADGRWRLHVAAYNPLERLATIRCLFFANPGRTLGQQQAAVKSQASVGYPENVGYTRNGISFAALNIQGSNNSMLPWTGLGDTAPTPEQVQEVTARTPRTSR